MHCMKWLERKAIHINLLHEVYYYFEGFIKVGKGSLVENDVLDSSSK